MRISTYLKTALLAGAGLYFIASCRMVHPTTTDNFTVNYKTADVKHGKALLYSSCGGCHYVDKTGKFSGRQLSDLPKILGKVYSANLTASPEYSPVPHYSDAELAYLVRTGIKRDGHFVPYMLRPNMSDQDLKDLIAYLRSGDEPVAASSATAGHTKLNFLGKLVINGRKPMPYETNIPNPTNPIDKGRYLVDNIGCFHCHSKKITSVNYLHPEESRGYLSGGAKFKIPGVGTVRGSNITIGKETGIGFFTEEDFRNAVQHAKAPNGSKLRPPMEAFHLTNEEADAIYAYINTLPPKEHKVKGQVQVGVVH